jgi:hypothetical protein
VRGDEDKGKDDRDEKDYRDRAKNFNEGAIRLLGTNNLSDDGTKLIPGGVF